MGLLLISTQLIYAQKSPAFEKVIDVSPDGKFALRISCSSQPADSNKIDPDLITAADLVSLPSKNSVIKSLQNYSGSVPDLIWSKDANWLAYSLASGPRVTDTYVHHRSGDDLVQLQTDDLRVDVKGDVRNEYVRAIRWVKPGVLLLEQFDILRGGEGKDATYRFTARFDDKTGKLQIVSKKKIPSKE